MIVHELYYLTSYYLLIKFFFLSKIIKLSDIKFNIYQENKDIIYVLRCTLHFILV